MLRANYQLLLAVILGFALPNLVFGQSFLGAQAPQVNIVQVVPTSWFDGELGLDITFVIENPNDKEININAIRYEMKVNNILVAKDWHEQDIKLPASGNTQATIPVKLAIDLLLGAAPDILLTNQLRYALTGAVVVKGLALHIPFDYQGVIPIIQ